MNEPKLEFDLARVQLQNRLGPGPRAERPQDEGLHMRLRVPIHAPQLRHVQRAVLHLQP
jgi:hypothetical protein